MQTFQEFMNGKLKQDLMNPHNWIVSIIIAALLLFQLVNGQAEIETKFTLAIIHIFLLPSIYVFVNWLRYRKQQNK